MLEKFKINNSLLKKKKTNNVLNCLVKMDEDIGFSIVSPNLDNSRTYSSEVDIEDLKIGNRTFQKHFVKICSIPCMHVMNSLLFFKMFFFHER